MTAQVDERKETKESRRKYKESGGKYKESLESRILEELEKKTIAKFKSKYQASVIIFKMISWKM